MSGPPARPRLGLVVNPLAGLGGAVGLKGSDGAATVDEALARGAVPHANERAIAALARLRERWPADRELPELLVGPGPLGETAARAAGLPARVVGDAAGTSDDGTGRRGGRRTSADDTRRVAAALAAEAELLLVAGGDGTARDVAASIPAGLPVLGIPAGVKIQSAVYATSPRAAGELAAAFLATEPARRRTAPGELLDLDEAAYRRGALAPRLHGELTVPAEDRRVQARKEPSPASEAASAAAIGREVAASLAPGTRCLLGPGSTVAAVGRALGIEPTLVGVDVVDIVDGAGTAPGGADAGAAAAGETAGRAVLVAADVGEAALVELAAGRRVVLVVTPIGGQGFVLGRGNQQLAPAVVRAVLAATGRDGIIVAATPSKLAALRGRPLLVETGDPGLDRELAGHARVVTGRGERTVYPVAAA